MVLFYVSGPHMAYDSRIVSLRVYLLGVLIALCCCAQVGSGQSITPQDEVSTLKAIRRQLNDPFKRLNWTRGDPCTSHWTGVICISDQNDGYLHVQELRLLRKNLSGTLAPELGKLRHVTILDFMWNNISGSIPKQIGDLINLKFLLLSGNQISGHLPDELGNLPNAAKFQLDLNYISGPLPTSFANLPKMQHFHMNNNSISGSIPPQLSQMPKLMHFLLDNNNLTGILPPEFSMMPNLTVLQLDNNNFEGSEIPKQYGNMSKLLKLSLRNCGLQGPLPDFSASPRLLYLDLSYNDLTGNIPTNQPPVNITTIDLSHNVLNGSIPPSFSGLPRLQRLSLEDNILSGNVPTNIWENMSFDATEKLVLNFRTNGLTDISGSLNPPPNVTIMLEDNPVCRRQNELSIVQYCGNQTEDSKSSWNESSTALSNLNTSCPSQSCPTTYYEYVANAPVSCYCAAPIGVQIRLRSPSIWEFPPYEDAFKKWVTSSLAIQLYQLDIDFYEWQKGPRLMFSLKIFPQYVEKVNEFNQSTLQTVLNTFATFALQTNDYFGPYDLIGFTLVGPYQQYNPPPVRSTGIKTGALVGVVFGCLFAGAFVVLAIVFVVRWKQPTKQKTQKMSKVSMKVEGIKSFTLEELEKATNNFEITSQIGQGGYGKVYRGVLGSGLVVAIKRARHGSLQGEKEFFTEIELLSRLHHRNLVSLVGYCDEESEQMLVYECMANGSLHNVLSSKHKKGLSFAVRLRIALGSAKGILYLHTEADPPIIHRDIKANNILLDEKFNAKVSDFGISRLFSQTNDDDGEDYETAHVSTNVKGTPGYVDPDYFYSHKLTEKSDVYSLGIVFLELLTGRPPISHGRNIVRQVVRAYEEGSVLSLIDRSMGPYPSESVKKFMELALKCCEGESKGRPTMLEVVRELENIMAQTHTLPPESDDASSSNLRISNTTDMSIRSTSSSLNYGTNSNYVSTNFMGSDLESGVIPSIRPR